MMSEPLIAPQAGNLYQEGDVTSTHQDRWSENSD